jgi:hypothetical protein
MPFDPTSAEDSEDVWAGELDGQGQDEQSAAGESSPARRPRRNGRRIAVSA